MRIIHPDDVTPRYLLEKRAAEIASDPGWEPSAQAYARAAAELHGWGTLPEDVAERLEEVGVCGRCLQVEADCACCACVCDCTVSPSQRDAGIECLCDANPECPQHGVEREVAPSPALDPVGPVDDDICFCKTTQGKYYEEESRASDEINRAPCKGGPTRGDQCEMDGSRAARCWRHHHRLDLAARLAFMRRK